MKTQKICILVAIAIFCLALSVYSGIVYLKEFTFDEEKPLANWHKMLLKGEVNYLPIKMAGQGFIRAISNKTCSALYYRINFRLDEYPLMTWRWIAVKFPDLSAVREEKDKDDYAARLYVIFPSLSFSSSRFIEYVWSEDLPVDTVIKNPAANNVKLIVARSGKLSDKDWVGESRNIYEDYIKAFGEKPRMKAGAVAIMCDADNSQTEAESLFDEIAIGTELGIKRRLK